MKIKRAMYIETDINGNNTVDFFLSIEQAREHAKAKLTEAISSILGSDYVIPAKDIDEDGYITHLPNGPKPEITSSEWGWTVFNGVSDTARASIEDVAIELTPEEIREAYLVEQRDDLLEDAKNALFELLKYQEDPEEGSYWAARDAVVEEFLFEGYGVSVQELVQPRSQFYILDQMVDIFYKRRNSELSEWKVWEQIARDALEERKETFKKEDPTVGRTWHAVSADGGESWTERWIDCDEAADQRARGLIAVRIKKSN